MSELEPVVEPKNNPFGIRHLQMVCMCLTMITLFIVRGCMGVAVLAMADESKINSTITVYDWDKNTQSIILSSFFWGYVAMQIPAGVLAKKFGGKLILLCALILNGVLSALLPIMAALGGWILVCVARVMMGLTQACLFPGSHTLLGQWFPPKERTLASGIVYGGVQVGTIIAMPLSGLLAETAIGWQLIFYVMAALLFFNAVVWYFFSASTPGEHRTISKEERQYIENSLNSTGSEKSMRTPWKKILTSVPLYAIIVTHVACNCSFVLFFVDMPTYLERGLGISLKTSAALSALPYVGMWIGNVGSTYIAEKMLNRKLMSITACRKLFNSIAMFGITGGLVVLSFMGPGNKSAAVLAIVVTLTMSGFSCASFMVNSLDLAPNFAGLLLCLSNFVASIFSILMPIITGLILLNDPTNISRWRIVFLMTAVISAAGNVFYLIFASSERQDWNEADYFDKKIHDTEELNALKNKEQTENNRTGEEKY